ncbi:hypothetical protein J5N97_019275 [Dioscorea zingiberensis]|uniref:Uncharacterized protein n=1 Tax=Dioscorea zingiberensis TaxID=325984 RepID=A0A9D5CDJ5_9LILI|nr:hypothetical protein J5N97_019275 [Dioscorea zingiberensis]
MNSGQEAAVEASIKKFIVEKESELRVKVGPPYSIRVRLLSGTTDIFGTELPLRDWFSIPPLLESSIFTWDGATIEMDGKSDTRMLSYVNVHAILDRRRALCKSSSGRSRLCMMLLSWACKQSWKPNFVDLDIGQGSNTIPGCIAATPVEMPNGNRYFVQSTCAKELSWTLERQFSGNAESRAAGMVINTMGWVLILHAIDTFNANIVLILGQREPNVDVVKLQKSGGVVLKKKKKRFVKKPGTLNSGLLLYGIMNDLSLHSNIINFSDITTSIESAITHRLVLVPANKNHDLLHLVLAVSYGKKPKQILSSNVAGFVYVTDIDDVR